MEETQASTQATSDQGGAGKGSDEKVTLTRAEVDALRRERDEARESERFWANRARGPEEPAAAAGADAEPDIETDDLVPEVTGVAGVDEEIFNDPDKWSDAVSKGPQAIHAFVRKAGYVTAQEAADIAARVAQRTVQVASGRMASDHKIVGEFPDLLNDKSEFFKQTASEVKAIVALDPNAARSPSTLYAAARTVQARLNAARSARRSEASSSEGDDYEPQARFEDERDRRARAAAQDTTRSRGRGEVDEESLMGPEARTIMRALGISEDEFRNSARDMRGERRRR
jgi:hypothetical protein